MDNSCLYVALLHQLHACEVLVSTIDRYHIFRIPGLDSGHNVGSGLGFGYGVTEFIGVQDTSGINLS